MPPAALGTAFSAVDSPERMSPTAAGRYDQPVTKDELLAHCLSKPGAWQDEPWEGDTVVKVGPKIFAFLGSGDGAATHGSVGVKCAANRDAADEWLKLYPDDASVMAYIGRSGWNTLCFGGAIPDDEVLDAVDESYRMIVAKLPKKDRPA
jgi:predicted DNA-binding protein (MmcQ/YjbR family)